MKYSNILLPVAYEEDLHISDVMEIAKSLLAPGGKITLLHVIDPPPAYVMSYIPPDIMSTNKSKVQAAMEAALSGVKSADAITVEGQPGRKIVDYAGREGIDLIVLRSHHPGIGDIVWGSTAAYVVRHADCSVHVLR